VPDFLSERFGGNVARFLGVIVLVCCSFTYVTAQIYGTGLIASRFLGMDFTVAVYVGLIGILLCAMLGGMRAVTWTQVAQYIVLIIAYLTPSSYSYRSTASIRWMFGQAIQDITALEQVWRRPPLAGATLKPHILPFQTYDPLNFFGLILCLMVGTASLPHILMRYFTTPSVREARVSVAWSLFFIFLLYFSAPAYAAFSKLEVYSNVIGKPLADMPAWVFTYGKLELVQICGANAIDPGAIAAACGKIVGHTGVLRLQDFAINTDVIVISTPEIAGMPYVIAGLVASGGLAAALSTADGLLLAIANALSHDVYYKMIDRNAPSTRRLVVARVLLVLVAILAAYTASTKPSDILAMVSWAFSLAAAGLFPVLVMGIWWKRANTFGAVTGIIVGFGLTLMYLVVTRYFPQFGVDFLGMTSNLNAVSGKPLVDLAKLHADPAIWGQMPVPATHVLASKVGWFNVNNISSALFGLPAGFVTIWVVSLLTPRPSQAMYDMLDDIRRPRGESILKEKTA
jgi:cation/acetate symporter